ncbi:MAG: histidine kinase [Hyphomicrobiales bacterium]|nr:MAG: histidine kinase [Hyphomicrobiales bacterium]
MPPRSPKLRNLLSAAHRALHRHGQLAVAIAAILFCSPFLLTIFWLGDEGLLLGGAHALSNGRRLYVDTFQVVPPLGFLITQDAAYLQPYELASATLDSTYRRLVGLIANDPQKLAQIEPLAGPIAQKRQEMAQTIELAADGNLAQALAIVRSGRGQTVMNELRETVRAFIAAEDLRLAERNTAVQAYRQWLVVAILAALASAATLAYVLFTRTQQQFSSLERASSALATQNETLEARVRERTAEAEDAREHAERERARVEALLQDTNHRIGNSLATVSSLLGLQVSRTRSEEVRMALDAAQARVHAIASAHRRLRLGADLETISADEFLDSVLEDLRTTHAVGRTVTFHGTFDPLTINARDATTIGIVLGELITNALKHAFPDNRPGVIWAKLARNAEGVAVLTVEDDGKGLSPEGAKSEAGLGAMIVKQLARQFGGEPHYEAREGGGTVVSVSLPELDRPVPTSE